MRRGSRVLHHARRQRADEQPGQRVGEGARHAGLRAAPRPPAPHILIGGLGMGFTLRAALAALGAGRRIVVAELVPAVVAWARGPMAEIFGDSLSDPRVGVREADVGRSDPVRAGGLRRDPARCRQRSRGADPRRPTMRCMICRGLSEARAALASRRHTRGVVVRARIRRFTSGFARPASQSRRSARAPTARAAARCT